MSTKGSYVAAIVKRLPKLEIVKLATERFIEKIASGVIAETTVTTSAKITKGGRRRKVAGVQAGTRSKRPMKSAASASARRVAGTVTGKTKRALRGHGGVVGKPEDFHKVYGAVGTHGNTSEIVKTTSLKLPRVKAILRYYETKGFEGKKLFRSGVLRLTRWGHTKTIAKERSIAAKAGATSTAKATRAPAKSSAKAPTKRTSKRARAGAQAETTAG